MCAESVLYFSIHTGFYIRHKVLQGGEEHFFSSLAKTQACQSYTICVDSLTNHVHVLLSAGANTAIDHYLSSEADVVLWEFCGAVTSCLFSNSKMINKAEVNILTLKF